MVDHEDVGVGRNIFGGSDFVVLVVLIVNDFKEITSVISSFCEFKMEGLNEAGGEL